MQRDHIHIVKRMSAPTDYCYEPHGTQWHQITDDGGEICYVQMSLDESRPYWVRYGILLENYFYNKLEDADFVADVVKKFPSRFS